MEPILNFFSRFTIGNNLSIMYRVTKHFRMKQTLNKQSFEVDISFYLLVHINKYLITMSAYAVK